VLNGDILEAVDKQMIDNWHNFYVYFDDFLLCEQR
jgi:hypothetical protein